VGKSALVEGLAQRIADGLCPAPLRQRHVIEVSALGLLVTSRFPDEFEKRVDALLASAGEGSLLFLDNIHFLLSESPLQNPHLSPRSVLQRLLARPGSLLIASTTPAQYERALGACPQLGEQFELHVLDPPAPSDVLRMIAAHKLLLEQDHGVTVTEEAIKAAVELSARASSDRKCPGAAIDLLERACLAASARPSMEGATVTPETVAQVLAR